MTSLEAISEKLRDTKQSQLEEILKVSGSSAITKNEYGVTVIDSTNVASSFLFKPLVKTKIDNNELIKAIDTNIKELKPPAPPTPIDYVPKSLYETATNQNKLLLQQVAQLESEKRDLNTEVATLKAQVESINNEKLNVEQSNDALTNQLNTLNQTVADFSKQIQSAVQKSVDESILRASLQSQNVGYKTQIDTLIKQVDSLNSIVDGLQTQLVSAQQTAQANVTTTTTKSTDPLEGTDVRDGGTVWRIIGGKKRHYVSYNNAAYRGVFANLVQVTSAQMDKYQTGPDLTLQEELDTPYLYAKK